MAVAAFGASAPATWAAEARIAGSTLVYAAAPEEENNVTISRSGEDFVIDDAGAEIAPGESCTQGGTVVAPDPNQAVCPAAGVDSIRVDLGDRDDTMDLLSATPAAISGGPGKDEIEGGGGNDLINGGTGSDTVRGGLGDDVVDGGPDPDDAIQGDDGNDTVISQDGIADNDVSCGVGVDSLMADAPDDVSPDCERVTRPCGRRRAAARVGSRPRPVRPTRRWAVRLPVRCRALGCSGTVVLRSASRHRGRRTLLATGRFRASGRRTAVALRILPRARELITHNRRLRVRAEVLAPPARCTARRAVTRFILEAPPGT